MKLETFTRDSQYLKVNCDVLYNINKVMYFQQLKDLDTIDIGFVRRESPAGHIDEER